MWTVCLGKAGHSIPVPITARASDVGSQGSSTKHLQYKTCAPLDISLQDVILNKNHNIISEDCI